MERYLRFYIKFQGYILAIGTILGAILMAFVIFINSDLHYPLEECKFRTCKHMLKVSLNRCVRFQFMTFDSWEALE